jgi:uncharacterized repeat protein (TIGR02543 family)
VTLTAVPAQDYSFSGWKGDAKGAANPVTVTMDKDKTVTADFDPLTFTLEIKAKNGSVTVSPKKEKYNKGESVTLTAVPASGYSFKNWKGDAKGGAASVTITMNENKTVTANFESNTCVLNIKSEDGSVTKSPNKDKYTKGESVTLTANPASGFNFKCWKGDAKGTANPVTITMDEDKKVTAEFEAYTYTLAVKGAKGTYIRSPNKERYNKGDVVTITAKPNSGYLFKCWRGGATGTTNPVTVTMDTNKTITAYYLKIPKGASSIEVGDEE